MPATLTEMLRSPRSVTRRSFSQAPVRPILRPPLSEAFTSSPYRSVYGATYSPMAKVMALKIRANTVRRRSACAGLNPPVRRIVNSEDCARLDNE
jgi:hypothetical protein